MTLPAQDLPRSNARDRARIEAAIRANPPGHELKLSAPASMRVGGDLPIRLDYTQESDGREANGSARGFMLEGFLVRGPVSCGAPELPCSVSTLPGDRSQEEGQRIRLAGQFFVDSSFTANVASLLPQLPPGEYVLWAVAREVAVHPVRQGSMPVTAVNTARSARRLFSSAASLRVDEPED